MILQLLKFFFAEKCNPVIRPGQCWKTWLEAHGKHLLSNLHTQRINHSSIFSLLLLLLLLFFFNIMSIKIAGIEPVSSEPELTIIFCLHILNPNINANRGAIECY